jgi:ABC-type transporter Mla subunit MlaD
MPENDAQTPGGTPRWVKVFGIVALVVVVVVVVMLITGRGDHGPGRHTVSGDSRATALFAVVRQP